MHIKEIQILTNNINQTESFYTGVLNLPTLYKTGDRISFAAGQSVLTFIQNNLIGQPIYHFAFNILRNQLQEAIEWSASRVTLLPVAEDDNKVADFSRWNAKAVYFYDNNRNILELIARYDLKNESALPFTGQSIECISEIGLVTDNVPIYADKLLSDYNISLFSKQPRKEKFTVLGDDHGLLILSETGRDWFPTHIPGKKLPVKVIIESENVINELTINLE